MSIPQFSERTRAIIELGGGAFVALWIGLLFLLGVFEIPELLTYDWRFQVRGEREPLKDILIITIDEKSEKALGQRYPWKRSLHAEMLRTLIKHKPKLIVYDVVFTTSTAEAEDEALANALYDAYDEEREMSLVVLAEYLSQKWEKPLTMFADNAGGVGVININKDRDAIVRSVIPVVYEIIDAETTQPHFYLSLEAAVLDRGGVNTIAFPRADTIVLSRIQDNVKEEELRLITPDGRLYLNYIGGSHSYPMISFSKILQGNYRPEDIAGKVIFIGDTLLTSHDCYLTPFRTPNRKFLEYFKQVMPESELPKVLSTFGVEIHAQVFQTIVENTYIHRIHSLWSVFLVLCVGSVSGILLFRDHRLWSNTLVLVLTGGLIWGVSQYLFTARNFWIDLVPLEIVILVNYVAGLGFHRVVALYNRNQVKSIFQYYVSPAVVEEILKHPEKVQLGGERKFLTVLFSDIRGFTSLSEGMAPHELAEFLNEYLTAMTNIVLKYRGTLDKYVGDEIMAIYGAPVDLADHAGRACATALEMIKRLRELQHRWREQGRPVIDIGIGINSGVMSVGNMGSDTRFDYTVTGDHVNLGARLEGTNKQYGTHILLSEYTYQELHNGSQPNPFVVRELDLVRVKGKKEPVRIYELIGRTGQMEGATLERIEHFEQGLAEYRNMLWDTAIEKFKQALRLELDDIPSQLYIQRCRAYQMDPPAENWDGVYTMTTK